MADDIRFLRSKNRINNTIVTLTKEKPFHKIRLTEVCRMAGINRTTFYKHYQDIYAWKEHYEDNCRKGVEQISSHCHNYGFEQALTYFLQSMVENQDFYQMLSSEKFESNVMNECIITLLEHLVEEKLKTSDIWDIKFYSNAIKGIIDYWISTEMKQSPEEICLLCSEKLK